MKIEITNRQNKIPFSLKKIRTKTEIILEILDLKDKTLSIVFCGDSYIRKLNRKYLNRDRATDVLAFGMIEGKRIGQSDILGDVIISVDTAARVAKSIKRSLNEELHLYLIHGILHLIGYRDDCETVRKDMERLQEKILKRLSDYEE